MKKEYCYYSDFFNEIITLKQKPKGAKIGDECNLMITLPKTNKYAKIEIPAFDVIYLGEL